MSFEYVKDYYDVPACYGRLISYGEQTGVIAEDRGHYIGVNFDDCKPGDVVNVHPTDENLKYLGMGKVRKMTKSQQNYRDYLRSEVDESFAEWMGFAR